MERPDELAADMVAAAPDGAGVARLDAGQAQPDVGAGLELEVGGDGRGTKARATHQLGEVLVQLGRPATKEPPQSYTPQRFRRARLFGEDMSEQERTIARAWGRSVGIHLPGE